ncbi:MAG: ribosomal protein L7/L12, partial [Lactococcus cremoris]
ITGLGLKEAKELVDGAPTVVKEGLSESEANEIKEKLEAAGASITLK